MGDLDDVVEMGEIIDLVGEEPPKPEDYQAEAPPTPQGEEQAPQPEAPPEPEDMTTGGLDGPPIDDDEEHGPLDLDKVLGITKPAEGDPSPAPTEEQPAEPAPDPEPSATEQRFTDLTERLNKADALNEKLIARALGPEKPEELPAEPPADADDPDVTGYMEPHIERVLAKKFGLKPGDLDSVMKNQEDQRLATMIGKHVEGFKAENVQSLYDEIGKMSAEEQTLYRDGGAGAILLAKELQSRGAFGSPKKQEQRSSSLAKRHQSEATGSTPAGSSDMSDQAKARQLMAMDGDEVLRILDGIEG